jgi:hypothetical protein
LRLSSDDRERAPYVPLSHPFVERLIGTVRREYLDRTLFWTKTDLLEAHTKAKVATVVDRLRASVLDEHQKAQEAGATVVGRLRAFAARR